MATRAVESPGSNDGYAITGRKLWITNGNEAGPVHRLRERQSRGRLSRHHGVSGRARLRRIHRRQEGRQARHPRQQHLRAALRGLPRPARERARRGRQGLQGRDRNAERGAHRYRRADDRSARRARSITPSSYTKERKQFGKTIAEFQAVQHQLARAATEVEAARLHGLQRRTACATRASRS